MNKLTGALATISLLLPIVTCHAQAAKQVKPPVKPQNAPILAPDYVLGPEDMIEINVRNHPDLNKTLVILPDGKIAYPELGDLQAAGKTPRALGAEIQTELEKTRNQVSVVVSVISTRSQRVRIVGAVKLPGSYELKPAWTLMDVVAVAGGLSAKPAQITGRLIRNGTNPIKLDIAKAVANPEAAANIAVEPNDLVLLDEIDSSRNMIEVRGQVSKPTVLELREVTTIDGVVQAAGGPTNIANLSRAYVERNNTRIPLDLSFLNPNNPISAAKADPAVVNFALRPGDVLVIPRTESYVTVFGAVKQPSEYPYPENTKLTVLQAVNLAGGHLSEADLTKTLVIRKENGNEVRIPVNLEDYGKKGKTAQNKLVQNVDVQPGDIIFLPSRKPGGGNSIGNGLSMLSILGVLGLRVFK
jgi:polysaccharide export outer membrane protein